MERHQEYTRNGIFKVVALILARWFVTAGVLFSKMTTPIVQAQWEAWRRSLALEDVIGGQGSLAGVSATETNNHVKVACGKKG